MASMTRRSQITPSSRKMKPIVPTQTSPTSQKLSTNRKRRSEATQGCQTGKDADHTTSPSPISSSAKRQKTATHSASKLGDKATPVDLTGDDDEEVEIVTPSKKEKRKATATSQDEEKRLKMFRKEAPLSYLGKLERAVTQRYIINQPAVWRYIGSLYRYRMFVIDRTRGGTDEVPEETVDIAGTTGNIYSVHICKLPTCTCPDNQKGNQCKHIIYVRHSTAVNACVEH